MLFKVTSVAPLLKMTKTRGVSTTYLRKRLRHRLINGHEQLVRGGKTMPLLVNGKKTAKRHFGPDTRRRAPPYKAAAYPNMVRQGIDKQMFISKWLPGAKQYRWFPVAGKK
jgi:hypothetical protein